MPPDRKRPCWLGESRTHADSSPFSEHTFNSEVAHLRRHIRLHPGKLQTLRCVSYIGERESSKMVGMVGYSSWSHLSHMPIRVESSTLINILSQSGTQRRLPGAK